MEPLARRRGCSVRAMQCSVCLGVSPDEADVDTQAAMEGRAVEADEDSISDRCPCGVLGIAGQKHICRHRERKRRRAVRSAR